MNSHSRLQYLLDLYKSGRISWEEHLELFGLIAEHDKDDSLQKAMGDIDWSSVHPMALQSDRELVYSNISEQLSFENGSANTPLAEGQIHRVHFLNTRWLRYAAVLVLGLGLATWLYISYQPTEKKEDIVNILPDIQAGSDKAILTLSDGRRIVLNDAVSERIADGNISIEKANGILTYNPARAGKTDTESYNVMNTPRGGQYQLVLPDGSKVWLNSASNLKYPTVFHGKDRIVELSGEAYFDIKENKKMPFIVKTKRGDVAVLGTEFNINSYENEPVFSTTLIEGSVKVSVAGDVKIITPGQQARLSDAEPDVLKINNDVDINQVIAWQKGIFEFNGATIGVIARQLSRWYDIDVTADVNNKNFKFSGGITKKTPLRTVLKILEVNGVLNKWENGVITLYAK